MSTPMNDGGAAFPSLQKVREDKPDGQLHWIQAGGMTLRDYFAGQALAGIMTREQMHGGENKVAAEWAYEMADALLAAREAKK